MCANVANLLLAHGAARERELAVRAAMGASRARLVWQLLAESLVLASLGCLGGLLLGKVGFDAIPALAPFEVPAWVQRELDLTVVFYTIGVSVVAAVIFGTAPALQSTGGDLNASLREGSRGAGAGIKTQRFRAALLVSEVALSLVLLVGASLMVQSLLRLSSVDPGFESRGRLTLGIDLLAHVSSERRGRVAIYEQLLERLQALPGVKKAAVVDRMPLKNSTNMRGYIVEGQDGEAWKDNPEALYVIVSGDYFDAMGIPRIAGGVFQESLDLEDPREMVVSESFARRFWSDGDAIDRRVRFGSSSDADWSTIVASSATSATSVWSTIRRPPSMYLTGKYPPSGSHGFSKRTETRSHSRSLPERPSAQSTRTSPCTTS